MKTDHHEPDCRYEVKAMPENAERVTDPMLIHNFIVEGWQTPDGQYFETKRYPGALNTYAILRLGYKPQWANP